MTSRHFDVVVLGRSLGALSAGVLLARRDFRVLVLGQGQRRCDYRFEDATLRRRAFTFLAASSPAWRRLLQELAQTPRFRRRIRSLDPMFTFATPGRRLQVPPEMEAFAAEIEREYPEVRQVVDELYATFAQVNSAADAATERDAIWPPGKLLERLEMGRLTRTIPLAADKQPADLLSKFPLGHGFRSVVGVPVTFATSLWAASDQLPPYALARLHGAWTRGVSALEYGEDELSGFLIERIEALGGLCLPDQRAVRVFVKRGAVSGVLIDGDEEPTGAGVIIADSMGEVVADLAEGEGITKKALAEWPRISAGAGRFITSLLVRRELIPDPLAVESFLVPDQGPQPDPRRPTVHLQWSPQPAVDGGPALALLTAEAILPSRGPLTLFEAREAVLATVREHLPFLDRHLLVVDSPHDGLPLWDFTRGGRREVDRIHVRESSPDPEPMQWLWTVEPSGWLGLAGEPVRGPIPGVFLVGSSVLPALGQEGELLAAWSAARLITQSDKSRQKLRRRMWNKIETG